MDDMQVNCSILSSMLSSCGILCDTALSGKECIELCRTNSYDLILLGHRMPGMDGYQVMEKIRSTPKNEHIPIIFLTGKNDRECVMKILERKPDGYLLKSMPREALLDSLDRFFAAVSGL
ncbi:MAG: response regulator [Lachnospiraceae bacterium]|nr:response regulator [Lachnospiraceae bacterium]